jgi:preprotein translocase SecE subunit
MAITVKQNNVADLVAKAKDTVVTKQTSQIDQPKALEDGKKQSFFKTTLAEIKKVEWPNFGYIKNWTAAILLFTVVLSGAIYGVDNAFNFSYKLVLCNSTDFKAAANSAEDKKQSYTLENFNSCLNSTWNG